MNVIQSVIDRLFGRFRGSQAGQPLSRKETFFVCLGIIILYRVSQRIKASFKVAIKQKAVVVTGCDTGFGRETALELDRRGIMVFAGCLTEKGMNDLNTKFTSDRSMAIRMDVTDEKSVEASYEQVRQHCPAEGVWAIINNAGILRPNLLELSTLDEWKLQLNVNVLGIVITTRQFLPLIRKAKGRIINVASVAGRLALPGLSGYSASKFAVQGLSDSLRREEGKWGVKVITIEPGIMKTPLYEQPFDYKAIDALWERLNEEQKERFGREYFIKGRKEFQDFVLALGGDPKTVVDTLAHVVCTQWPKTRYTIGKETPGWLFLSVIPDCVSDFLLNALDYNVPAALQKRRYH